MHVHVGLIEFLITCAYIVIFHFFARAFAVKFADTAVGKAVAWLV